MRCGPSLTDLELHTFLTVVFAFPVSIQELFGWMDLYALEALTCFAPRDGSYMFVHLQILRSETPLSMWLLRAHAKIISC